MSAARGETSRDCRALFARLSEYLDGELPGPLCEEIRAHLEDCPACEQFCETLRRAVALCRELPAVPLPDDLRLELRVLLDRLTAG
jgi:anti-sigma factor RsiW